MHPHRGHQGVQAQLHLRLPDHRRLAPRLARQAAAARVRARAHPRGDEPHAHLGWPRPPSWRTTAATPSWRGASQTVAGSRRRTTSSGTTARARWPTADPCKSIRSGGADPVQPGPPPVFSPVLRNAKGRPPRSSGTAAFQLPIWVREGPTCRRGPSCRQRRSWPGQP